MPRTRTALRATAAASVLLVATACNAGTPASPDPADALDFSDLAQDPPAGTGDAGTIHWNLPYEPLSLDPIKTFNYAENTALANSCEALLRANPDFTVGPGLAEKWDQPDPTTWVFHLRPGVTFWNGKPLTAEDVAWSIGRHLDPDSGSYVATYLTNVASVTASGPLEVTMRMKKPDALLTQALASLGGIVTEKASSLAAGEDFGTPQHLPMCTGPFRLDSWKPGQAIELSRNDAYWDDALKPLSSKLELSFVTDESTAVLALESGELDGEFFYLPPAGLDKLRNGEDTEVVLGTSLAGWYLLGAASDGPFADPDVRRALSMATDRAAIASTVLQNTAIPARSLATPASWTYGRSIFEKAYDELPGTDVDIEAATKLVEDSGVGDQPITIAVQGSSVVHEQTANLLQAAGEAIGLHIEIKTIPVEQYGNVYVDPQARKGIDAFLSTYYSVADPLDSYLMFEKDAYNNYGRYDAIADQLVAARSETDDETRAELVAELEHRAVTDEAWLPLEYLPVILVQNKRITGSIATSNYLYYPWASAIGTR
ncbi:ABC transporter substrate-binding protein [Nocardioides kongjuensis]|uniref:Peptide/nickel transport system substrate-binding protein n=1 Tax=Nocardioides kongjuensis TaxID=349522 RepID=A0A852RD37_9ACTN|nr:ABC transporter substrate-binding protein [Nocardioides kongjuensis]NYD28688.1 peptide/nickel transport system substrate-binding protein [Nocardioides kongjuensis]